MLIEFRVENHRSLRDEQALSLQAAPVGDSFDERPRKVPGHGHPLLPAAVIYGANASGKSNVLSALAFMREAVLRSHRRWDPEGGIPRAPFAWGGKRDASSLFEVSILTEGIRYSYGFVVNDESVLEEWLFAWPSNRKQIWFERERGTFRFGDRFRGPNDSVRAVTRSNALFLSTGAQHGHPQLASLYKWFRNLFPVNTSGQSYPVFFPAILAEIFGSFDEEQPSLFPNDDDVGSLAVRMRSLLKAADVGIVDIKRIELQREYRGRTLRRHGIRLQHQAGDEESWLDLEDESEGTRTLFRIAPSLFRTLDSGGVLLVDELESSLHPLLGLAIVRLFNCPRANPANSQILFTTHDTNLLGTTLGKPALRRDQIWFTEKDAEGASNLYPLTDYKPRKSENLERGYLQGRYGAIPFWGDTDWITG